MEQRKQEMDGVELEKETSHIVIELVEYVPNAVVSRTIIKKITGNITAISFAVGEEMSEKTMAFDSYVQIIDGEAVVLINGKPHELLLGRGIVIPAHARHSFHGKQQFKMLSTVIKSGYEDSGLDNLS